MSSADYCPEKVIGVLRELLYDINMSRKDLLEYVERKGYCAECFYKIKACECESSETEEEEPQEAE